VTIPVGAKKIEGGTFADCTSLKSVTIPSTVTYIGSGAFKGSGLLDIYIKCATPPYMLAKGSSYTDTDLKVTYYSSSSFSTNTFNNATLHVPSGLKGTYAYDEHWGSFVHIVDDL
jgi:hypothetical protein